MNFGFFTLFLTWRKVNEIRVERSNELDETVFDDKRSMLASLELIRSSCTDSISCK